MKRYLIIDSRTSPAMVVIATDDKAEADDVANRYAGANGHCVFVETKTHRGVVWAPKALAFASPEDAARAGFREPSGDGSK